MRIKFFGQKSVNSYCYFLGHFLKTKLELKQQKLTELLKGHNNYMKTADQRRTLPAVTNATTGAKCNKGAIRNNPQQGIGTKSKVLRKRNYIKGGIPYIDIHIGSLP